MNTKKAKQLRKEANWSHVDYPERKYRSIKVSETKHQGWEVAPEDPRYLYRELKREARNEN